MSWIRELDSGVGFRSWIQSWVQELDSRAGFRSW